LPVEMNQFDTFYLRSTFCPEGQWRSRTAWTHIPGDGMRKGREEKGYGNQTSSAVNYGGQKIIMIGFTSLSERTVIDVSANRRAIPQDFWIRGPAVIRMFLGCEWMNHIKS
ncbi:hypothetical protein CEXT_170621, partial [Caerostris extrusa]